MKRRSSIAVWAVVGMAALSGCAPAAPEGLTDADRAAFAAGAVSLAAAANAGDFAAWGAYFADGAVQLPPNSDAVVGRDAIVALLKSFPPMRGVRFMQDAVEGSGSLAYVQGRYEMTMTPPGAAAISDRGKYIEIWRKQPDGRWLIDRDIFNSSLPLPPPAP